MSLVVIITPTFEIQQPSWTLKWLPFFDNLHGRHAKFKKIATTYIQERVTKNETSWHILNISTKIYVIYVNYWKC